MKTKFKKIVSILCVTAMLVVFAVPAMAANNGISFDMDSFGITAGMDAGEREQEFVRRDEFAQMVVNMMMQQDVANALADAAYFIDVADSQYKGAVNLLAKLGYISGSGTGTFNPDGYITYGAASKILVHALGYNVITEGTDLFAYMSVAGNIGVTRDIDSSAEYLTFYQTMRMINNALDVDMMVPAYYNNDISPSYEIAVGRTYRSLLNGRTGTGLSKFRGIVTADVSTFMNSPVYNLKPNQLQIEGKVYTFIGEAPKGYVGQEVEFYMTTEDFEDGFVTSIIPTKKNYVCDFYGPQVNKITSSEISFLSNDGTKNKVSINSSTKYIYNNRLKPGYNIKNVKADESVVLRTINNDEDDVAEVVFIYDYTDCIVENVSLQTQTVSFEDGFTLGTTKSIKLDEKEIYFELFDSKGNKITVEDLVAGDVLSVAISDDKKAVRLIKGVEPVSGVTVSRDGEYITIDNTEYLCGDTVDVKNMTLGVNVVAYLNFLGTLVDYEEEIADHNYAYVYSYGRSGGTLGSYKVKLLLPEYISIKKVEGAVDELSGEASTSNALFVRNKDVVIYNVEDKVVFNGVKTNVTTVLPQILDTPVSYGFNSNGNISKIDTLQSADEARIVASEIKTECVQLNKKKYNGTEQLFGGGKGSPFGIKKDYTLAFCVPMYNEQPKSEVTDADLKVFVQLSNGLEYESNGYVIDETSEVADVLVIQKIMSATSSIAVVETTDVGLVLGVSDVLLEDGQSTSKVVKMLADGKEVKYVVSEPRLGQSALAKLEKFDLIQYTLDAFDQINTVKILQKNNSYYQSSTDEYMYGEIKDIKYNKISNTKVRRVNKVAVGYSNSSAIVTNLELLVRNPAPVFIIDNDEASVGSLNDINIGDMVYFSIYNVDSVRAVIINR